MHGAYEEVGTRVLSLALYIIGNGQSNRTDSDTIVLSSAVCSVLNNSKIWEAFMGSLFMHAISDCETRSGLREWKVWLRITYLKPVGCRMHQKGFL